MKITNALVLTTTRAGGPRSPAIEPLVELVQEVVSSVPSSVSRKNSVTTELSSLIAKFVEFVVVNKVEIYNEFSLQHELGIFLRNELPGYLVQFERNIKYFSSSNFCFTKRELDIAVFSMDKSDLKFAIELKYPRNGQHPETMFSFCKDIAFAEELKIIGFSHTALVIFVDDHLFYSGSSEGIYGYFRGGRPLGGRIEKPTGAKNEHV